ncbi:hypothetical protein ASZ78_012277 [Callipepla squamata]|uniref:5'-3' DNA helicase ZGRF1 n=1 Tax=Callipepla squamata TaxID=9009 RepID=A0A226NLR4_CALSU|nr:hypothetical protein ASZ78_012277 [Callipepla squamata]
MEATDDTSAENVLGMLMGDTGESQSSTVNNSAPGSVPLLTAKSTLGECCAHSSNEDLISERKLLSLHLNQTPLTEPAQKVLSHLTCRTVTGDVQGRAFYACDAPRAERCSFFKWVEEVNPAQIKKIRPSVVLHDVKSIGTYLQSQKIFVFDGCQLLVRYSEVAYVFHGCSFGPICGIFLFFGNEPVMYQVIKHLFWQSQSNRKSYEIRTRWCGKLEKFMNVHAESDGDSKNKLYLKLNRKEHYSLYSKDDIWVVSKTLNFDPLDTFIASSAFFGPTHNNEVELLPLTGYYPSNWHSYTSVHALLVCNASGELISLRNMEEYFNPSTLPLMPYLLKMNLDSEKPTRRINKRKFIPPAMSLVHKKMYGSVSAEVAMELAEKMILTFSLNPDQATSLIHIAQMMASQENMKAVDGRQIFPITIIHGVFGAGKSYLLSVVILFLVQLFERSEAKEDPELAPWKLLVASSTNVAVDRVLLCLLNLGFEDFIRVGSIRKIAKAILPYRTFFKGFYFFITFLFRFQCEKLVLVGDPKQLPPTIQGSESVHEKGLEQTLFDRLCLMGHKTILLRTQYRCHPAISAIANELFYEGNLIDGVSEKERSPLLDWLPTLCFYSVNGLEQIERDNSFYNVAEVHFTVKLIKSLIASGIDGSAVGVITFYKSQMCKIQNLLRSVHSEAFPMKAVQVSTVDAFQGAEKEIIVLSCVRTKQTGFTDSEKRMNVALTRAKRHLLIVGNLACLSKNRLYERVINHCKGWENGLQHVSQCEQQLNNILNNYLEEKKEEEKSKKKEK